MKPQTKSYEPPTAVRYGTVRGLTASMLKCSPGGDAQLSAQYAEFKTVTGSGDPASHRWWGVPDTLVDTSDNGFASRDGDGVYIHYDGCDRT